MAVKLHRAGLEHAGKLVREGRVVNDDRDAWSEHQPSAAEENQFIRRYGFAQFGRWHLGIDDERPENTKGRYKFPYGDFKNAHRCALLSAESRAGRFKYLDIEKAAHRLHLRISEAHTGPSPAASPRPAPGTRPRRL
jgi:hypothetical protein